MDKQEKIEVVRSVLLLSLLLHLFEDEKDVHAVAETVVDALEEPHSDTEKELKEKIELIMAHNRELQELLNQTELVIDESCLPECCRNCKHLDELFESAQENNSIKADEDDDEYFGIPEGFWN